MKVAVSIPDPVFAKADALARRMKLSRSKIYARAVDEFVERHSPDDLTDVIDAALDEIGDAGCDTFVREAGRQAFRRLDW